MLIILRKNALIWFSFVIANSTFFVLSGGFCPGRFVRGILSGGFCPGGLSGGFCPVGFVLGVLSGGFCPGSRGVLSTEGFVHRGVLSSGALSGVFCPGGFVLESYIGQHYINTYTLKKDHTVG